MREILFRGKRAYNGEWIVGDLLQDICGKEIRWYDNDLGHRTASVISETVGQYTGRSIDENKLFDGDILQNSTGIFVVCWDRKFLHWHVTSEKGVGCYNLNTLLTDKKRPCKKIGNRWDNPELLQEVSVNDR